MLISPLTKNAPKIHDDRSDGVSPPAHADREDDRDRTGGREQERDQAVGEVDAAEVGERLARRGGVKACAASSAALPVYVGRGELQQPRLLALRQREAA